MQYLRISITHGNCITKIVSKCIKIVGLNWCYSNLYRYIKLHHMNLVTTISDFISIEHEG